MILAVSIIPISLNGIIKYRLVANTLMQSLENQFQGVASIQEARIKLLLDKFSDDIKMLSCRPNMKKRVYMYDKTRKKELMTDTMSELSEVTSTIPLFHEISILNPSGEILFSTDDSKMGNIDDKSIWFTEGTKKCGYVDTFNGKNNEPDFWYSCPMLMEDKLVGVVAAIVDGVYLLDITNDHTGLGRTGETVLGKMDENGDALFIVPLRHDKKAAFTRKASKLDTQILINKALSRQESNFSVARDYRGVEVIGIVRYLERVNWGLVVKIDRSEFMEPLIRFRNYMIIGYTLLIAFIALAITYLVNHITHPLRDLTKMASRIAEGDMSHTVEVSSDNEIGILSNTLNQMKDKLNHARLQLHKKMKELQVIIDTLPGIFYLFDHNDNVLMWNNNLEEVTKYQPNDINAMSAFDLIIEEDRDRVRHITQRVIDNVIDNTTLDDKPWLYTYEACLYTGDNRRIPYYFVCSLVVIDAKPCAVVIGIDMTKQKETETQILATLRDKEMLLKEVHHRVKNNLQVVCSLLYLQSVNVDDPGLRQALIESRNRVMSMALIHERLYKSKDISTIDFGQYIKELATDIFYSFGIEDDKIRHVINSHNICLSIDTAIPCGLIINELVTNALKHGFTDNVSGEIRIDMSAKGNNTLMLVVSDNGVGIPQDIDNNTASLGLRLVRTLTEQLDGTLEINRDNGTEFRVTFREQKRNGENSAYDGRQKV